MVYQMYDIIDVICIIPPTGYMHIGAVLMHVGSLNMHADAVLLSH